MSLVRFQPWRVLSDIQDQIDDLFEQSHPQEGGARELTQSGVHWQPRVDIKDQKDKFLIMAEIPGVDPKDIDVSMEDGVLTIQGSTEDKHEDKDDNYVRIERFKGSFYRQFNLPQSADQDNISARSNQGVLEVTIPKVQQKESKKVEVKSE